MPTRISPSPWVFIFLIPGLQPEVDTKTPWVSSSWLSPAFLLPFTVPWASGPSVLPDRLTLRAPRLSYYKRTFELALKIGDMDSWQPPGQAVKILLVLDFS